MIYQLHFTDKANEDVLFYQNTGNNAILRKISSLLKEITEHPFTGTGKPEPLKHQLAGKWSRRINHEHRLIYENKDNCIVIHSLRTHYK